MRLNSGWTLHEMLVSLAVTGGIFVLASNAALGHLRFFRGTGEIVALRTQLHHATAIAANVLRTVESSEDILVAQDSAAEVFASYGASFACATDTGGVVIPAPSPGRENSLANFGDTPQAGDRVRVLIEDDTSASWVSARMAAPPSGGAGCAAFAGVTSTWTLGFIEPLVVYSGAALRFSRRTRISSYRASDGRWYLGLREWNGSTGAFNVIQPVAGPLLPLAPDPATTGFLLSWSDSTGATLPPPVEPARVATLTVTSRGETVRPARVAGLWSRGAPRYQDSLAAVVAIRNRP